MKRKSPGINKILRDQGSKFSSLLESGIKNLGKTTGSAMKKYSRYDPVILFIQNISPFLKGVLPFALCFSPH